MLDGKGEGDSVSSGSFEGLVVKFYKFYLFL